MGNHYHLTIIIVVGFIGITIGLIIIIGFIIIELFQVILNFSTHVRILQLATHLGLGFQWYVLFDGKLLSSILSIKDYKISP